MSAGALFQAGRLSDAIAAVTAQLRQAPGAAAPRILLAELLLFAGKIERADSQMDTAGTVDPSLGIAVAEFRQLLRAEQARTQLLTVGRVPEFLDEGPTAAQRAALACAIALRAGDLPMAVAHAAAAEVARPAAAFTVDGEPAEDLRDADDLIGGSLEVLTPTGKYLWIPFERVASLILHPPERPRDLYWRRATLAVIDGPNGDVCIPAIYAGTDGDEALQLGRATDWRERADGLTCGVGQRMLLAGAGGVAMMELATLVRAG